MQIAASMLRRATSRAAMIALVVGTVLVLINHGDHIAMEPICPHFYLKATLSYLTPFLVSLFTTILAMRDRSR